MRKIISICFLIQLLFISCTQSENAIKREDPIEAGREFIDASLKGNYEYAKKYLLADSINMEYFNELVNFNNKLSKHDKDGYKSSNIIIDSIQNISDTIAIINYSNTFKNTPDKIKLVRVNKEWLVDFKYTFSGN
jgi:type IV secretory pathway component VirB8